MTSIVKLTFVKGDTATLVFRTGRERARLTSRERRRMKRFERVAVKFVARALLPYKGQLLTSELIESMKKTAILARHRMFERYAHLIAIEGMQ